MDKITIIIFTHNEEKNIEDCINSAKLLTTQILIIDMESSDKSLATAKKMNVRVINHPFSHYVEPARQFGIEKASTDWVFVLDADERITQDLAQEIKQAIKNGKKLSYYKIARKNCFFSHWLKHGGWWPDYQIRLINKSYFISWPKEIHSTPKVRGTYGYLKYPLVHNFHGDLQNMVDKTIVFEDIESNLLFRAGRSATTVIFFRKFLGETWRRLAKRMGFLDGTVGIIEGIYQAFSKTITYLFLYEKSSSRSV